MFDGSINILYFLKFFAFCMSKLKTKIKVLKQAKSSLQFCFSYFQFLNEYNLERSEVSTEVLLEIQVFWDIMLSQYVNNY